MGIKATCDHCGKTVNAKDSLAGKRVKCPQCAQPFTIPNPNANPAGPTAGGYADAAQMIAPGGLPPSQTRPSGSTYNPMLDLLDDAGVESVARGPACDNCGAEVAPGAVVCVQCGYNMVTGEMLETEVYDDEDGDFDTGTTDAEKMLAQAERDIEDTPIAAEDQDFRDGNTAMLIAICALVVFGILLVSGLSIIMTMDKIREYIDSPTISLTAAIFVYTGCAIWITAVGFMADKVHGMICVFTLGLYCMIFGFMQRGIMLPAIFMILSFLIGAACYAYIRAQDSAVMLLAPMLA